MLVSKSFNPIPRMVISGWLPAPIGLMIVTLGVICPRSCVLFTPAANRNDFGTPAKPTVQGIDDDAKEQLKLDDATLADGSQLYRRHCLHCHGEEAKPKGGLDLRWARSMVAGGDSGPAVESGRLDESLIKRLPSVRLARLNYILKGRAVFPFAEQE